MPTTSKPRHRPTTAALPDPQNLDPRCRSVYEAVKQALLAQGYPPSLREIGAQVGLNSPSSVKNQLDKLERLGFIRRDPRLPRALEIVGVSQSSTSTVSEPLPSVQPALSAQDGNCVQVPLVGRIAAGAPILAEQNVEEVMYLPQRLTGQGELFMLEVHGDSMIDAAICDGDWVVVRSQPDASNGDIVAALLQDVDGATATVKVLSRRDGHQWLLPRNPDCTPIAGDAARIMGKVVSVLRSL